MLKNIRFKSVSATILSIEQVPRVLVEWELERSAQDLRNLRFYIDRGESPSELRPLNAAPLTTKDLAQFVDYAANLKDLHKVYHYRVRAVEMSGGQALQTFTSPLFSWVGRLDLVGLYAVEEHLFLYRFTSAGSPCLIFQKRHEGERCPSCWDAVLKRVTKSNCAVCYGTGFMGGYYPPIDAWMGFEPDAKVDVVADWGRRQPNQTDVRFTNYPQVRIDDVILEAETFKFWKVSQISQTEKNRATTLQFMRVDAVNRSDIEYQLEIPQARVDALLDQLEQRKREREF